MRATISILLIVVISSLSCGLLEYAHNRVHEMGDAAEDALVVSQAITPRSPLGKSSGDGSTPDREAAAGHHHDESNCPTHAQLHMALAVGDIGLPPILLGVDGVSNAAPQPQLITNLFLPRSDCRDPPTI